MEEQAKRLVDGIHMRKPEGHTILFICLDTAPEIGLKQQKMEAIQAEQEKVKRTVVYLAEYKEIMNAPVKYYPLVNDSGLEDKIAFDALWEASAGDDFVEIVDIFIGYL